MDEDEDWIECQDCGGTGEIEHDCWDDTCCCADPEDESCEACGGCGGWMRKARQLTVPKREEAKFNVGQIVVMSVKDELPFRIQEVVWQDGWFYHWNRKNAASESMVRALTDKESGVDYAALAERNRVLVEALEAAQTRLIPIKEYSGEAQRQLGFVHEMVRAALANEPAPGQAETETL